MSYVEFANGMRIDTPETVKADENGIVKMARATITLDGKRYECRSVILDTKARRLSWIKFHSDDGTVEITGPITRHDIDTQVAATK